jgi:hypothetical protein
MRTTSEDGSIEGFVGDQFRERRSDDEKREALALRFFEDFIAAHCEQSLLGREWTPWIGSGQNWSDE